MFPSREKETAEEHENIPCKRKLSFSENDNKPVQTLKEEAEKRPDLVSSEDTVVISVEIVEGDNEDVHIVCKERRQSSSKEATSTNALTEVKSEQTSDAEHTPNAKLSDEIKPEYSGTSKETCSDATLDKVTAGKLVTECETTKNVQADLKTVSRDYSFIDFVVKHHCKASLNSNKAIWFLSTRSLVIFPVLEK